MFDGIGLVDLVMGGFDDPNTSSASLSSEVGVLDVDRVRLAVFDIFYVAHVVSICCKHKYVLLHADKQ